MMPPRRYKRRHWHCSACAAELGRLRTTASGGWLLIPTELVAARKIGERTWLLTCAAGHETEWRGDEIHWADVPYAA